MLEIWSAGPNGIAEGGSNDDELLGTGGTDSMGNFTSSPGIRLFRPLGPDDEIFAIDRQNALSGPTAQVIPVGAAPAPTMTPWGFLASLLALLGVANLGLLRRRFVA